MLKYTKVDYNNKESLKQFYDFYQEVLLTIYDFDTIGTYQNFVENNKSNPNNIILLISNDNKILGGSIINYIIETNTGIINYLATIEENVIEHDLIDLSHSEINNLANQYGNNNPDIKIEIPKSKKTSQIDKQTNNENTLLKIMVKKLENN